MELLPFDQIIEGMYVKATFKGWFKLLQSFVAPGVSGTVKEVNRQGKYIVIESPDPGVRARVPQVIGYDNADWTIDEAPVKGGRRNKSTRRNRKGKNRKYSRKH